MKKRKGGIGICFPESMEHNVSEKLHGDITNNIAELSAILRAFEIVDTVIDPERSRKLLIKTDSKLCVDTVNIWMPGWKRRGWRLSSGDPPANLELLKLLDVCSQTRPCEFRHVRAHRKDISHDTKYNNLADLLANQAAKA